MPEANEISVDEYLDKRSLSVNDGVVYRAARMPKSFDAATRSAVFTMTDETTDSYGDTVRAKGADLTRFETNPICLLNHNSGLILGSWSDIQKKPKRIEGRATIAAEGTAPHVDMAHALLEQGILRAASIGFMPKKLERKLDDKGEPTWSYDILEWELYECSIVAVPSNPAALAKSIKQGNTLAREFLDEVLDTYEKTAAGLIVPKAELEAAHKEATGNKTTIGTVGVSIDAKGLAELRGLVERMEKAAERVSEANEPDNVPELDPLEKEAVDAMELALKGIEPKIEEIPETEERRGVLSGFVERVRSAFRAPEPEKPILASQEAKDALKKRLEGVQARHVA